MSRFQWTRCTLHLIRRASNTLTILARNHKLRCLTDLFMSLSEDRQVNDLAF